MPYQVNFIDEYLKNPVITNFLESCPLSLENKIVRQMQHLKEFGLTQANPNLKKITASPLWEIRILGKQNVRLICVSLKNREIVILHLFYKKTNKTSAKDINLALKRLSLVID